MNYKVRHLPGLISHISSMNREFQACSRECTDGVQNQVVSDEQLGLCYAVPTLAIPSEFPSALSSCLQQA